MRPVGKVCEVGFPKWQDKAAGLASATAAGVAEAAG